MRMKPWIAGLLSVVALGLVAEQAMALFWKHCCGRRHGTYICCRPYNAFSPVCFGNLYCDGCCPLQGYGNHHLGASWSPACGAPSLVPNGMHAHAMPGYGYGQWMPQGGPYMASPEPDKGPPPSFTPPPPTPVPPNTSWFNPYNPAPFGVQPASYPPGYYPGYWPHYPMGYWTNAYPPSQYASQYGPAQYGATGVAPPYGPWAAPNGR